MATNFFDIVDPTWRSLPDLEYGYWMVRFGEALEVHEDHQGDNSIPPPLANGTKIKDNGHHMIALSVAAEGGDRFKTAEKDAFRPQAELQVSATVNWVGTRSVLENKPSIRQNLPIEEKKERKAARSSLTAGVVAPSKGRVKRSDDHSGTIYISVGKVPNASMYFVQFCQDNPADEASWVDGGQSDSCRGIEVKGLKPGEVYHFRVRCFGGGQFSPWSQIITVRVL